METRISESDFVSSLSEILERVCREGETFIIEREGTAVAAFGPPKRVPGLTAKEILAGLEYIKMPGDGYADDLEWAKRNQPPLPEPPEWPD